MMAAIDRKLDALGAKFDTHSKRDEEQLKEISDRLGKFDRLFDGSESAVGLKVQIDRLQQKQIERSRVFWWAMTIVGALIAAETGVLLRVLAHLP